MTNVSECLGRLRSTQQTLQDLRDDLSKALVTRCAADGETCTEVTRLQDLHRRVSTALSAVSGDVRER